MICTKSISQSGVDIIENTWFLIKPIDTECMLMDYFLASYTHSIALSITHNKTASQCWITR